MGGMGAEGEVGALLPCVGIGAPPEERVRITGLKPIAMREHTCHLLGGSSGKTLNFPTIVYSLFNPFGRLNASSNYNKYT